MNGPDGIQTLSSPYSVDATVSRLMAAVAGKGLQLFADVDHGGGAAQAGLSMRPAHVLIFGHPRAGTPLMVARPLIALDLPLQVLVWEDSGGRVSVSFATGDYLAKRYDLPADLAKPISGVAALVESALTPEESAQGKGPGL